MGSRAIAVLARDAEAAARRFGVDDGSDRRRLHPHRPPVLRRRPDATLVARLRGSRARRCSTRWSTDWLAARLRAAAVVGEGDGADPRPVRVGRAPRPRRALPAASTALDGRGRARAGRRATCRRASGSRARQRRARSATATRAYCWPIDGLDGVTPRAVPDPRLRGPGARRRPSRTPGTSTALGAARRRPADHADPARLRRPRRRASRRTARRTGGAELTAPAARAWSSSPGPTRDDEGRVQPGLKVRGREYLRIIYGPDYTERTSTCCATRHLGQQALARPARARPRPRGARPASPTASRCGGSTRRSSRCWPWSPSRSTRGCDGRIVIGP